MPPRPGNMEGFRLDARLAMQANRNQNLRSSGISSALGDLVDRAGPPSWDVAAWEQYRAQTGEYPFSAEELPPSMEGCPRACYEMMGLRPPLMAQGQD